jgi:hypothetical protein
MVKAKSTGKSSKIPGLDGDENYSTGLALKVPVTNSQYAEVGNLTPAKLRALNIKKENAKLQVEWAREWFDAVKELEGARKEIEEIRSNIEKLHFKTEKDIDEYVLASLLAKAAYEEHFREWTARKTEELGLLTKVTDDEIRAVSVEFSDRVRVWKAKIDQRISDSNENSEAAIAQFGRKKDNGQAERDAQARARLKAFTSGKPMEYVNAIGAGSGSAYGTENKSQTALLDKLFTFGQ